ncbi:interleukin 17-like protein [Ptychodera flava]|uniref:interleukin 17-like protein n=1 Tax=Ptychodera flava TaxID=63121 RepID=UPI00396A9293
MKMSFVTIAVALLLAFVGLVHASPIKRDVTSNTCTDSYIEQISEANKLSMYPHTNVFGMLPFDNNTLPVGGQTPTPPPVCTTEIADPGHAPAENRSTCPYYYSYQTEEDRIPRTLTIVNCVCEYCIADDNSFHLLNTCQQITQAIPVLRRKGCMDGLYKYELEMVDVPVACACLRPLERSVDDDLPTAPQAPELPPGIIG